MPAGKKKRKVWIWKAEYFLFRMVEGVIQLLPPRFADDLGIFLGKIAYHLIGSRRRIVERNFRIGWEMTGEELRKTTKRCMETCGANLLGGVRCGKMTDAEIAACVEIEGAEILRQALGDGKGVIVALAHMGNWEILARMGSLVVPGCRCAAFYRPLNNPYMNRLMVRRRSRNGTKLIAKRDSLTQATAFLRSGGTLGILADQFSSKSGEVVPFFGRATSCSPLPALLHRRTQAPLLYASVARTSAARWKLVIFPGDAVADTATVMLGIERALRISPIDGFWLHNRWKISSKKPLEQKNRRVSNISPTKPLSVYFHLSQDPTLRHASTPAVCDLLEKRTDIRAYTNLADVLPAHVKVEAHPEQWEQDHILPLDVVIWMDHPPQKKVRIPAVVIAGYGKKSVFTRPLTATQPLHIPQTWVELLIALGAKPLPHNNRESHGQT